MTVINQNGDARHIFEQVREALLNSDKPSRLFTDIFDRELLDRYFPEIVGMIGLAQNPVYHPEGDVFTHTMLVLDCAAMLRSRAEEPLSFMFAALLHDMGKCAATCVQEDGRITAYGHEVLGDELILSQMRRIGCDDDLKERVLNHVRLHMRPNMLYAARSKKKKTRALFDLSLCPNDLILLSRADASGKTDAPYDPNAEIWLRERLQDYFARIRLPMLTEDDLRSIGINDPALLAVKLRRARELHLSGLDNRRALKFIMNEILHENERIG